MVTDDLAWVAWWTTHGAYSLAKCLSQFVRRRCGEDSRGCPGLWDPQLMTVDDGFSMFLPLFRYFPFLGGWATQFWTSVFLWDESPTMIGRCDGFWWFPSRLQTVATVSWILGSSGSLLVQSPYWVSSSLLCVLDQPSHWCFRKYRRLYQRPLYTVSKLHIT